MIDNARIVDGTGAPSRHGSVAVKDGRIVEVAAAAGQAARERLDAGGLAVAPGFIDPHTTTTLSSPGIRSSPVRPGTA